MGGRETRWPRPAWLEEASPWRRSVRRDPCPHVDRGDGDVPPISDLTEDTIAAAKVTPRDSEHEAFIVVSMYARWLKPHPSTKSRWKVGCSDTSAHRIMSDLSAFIGHSHPTTHRILAAGDLNMFYGSTGDTLSLPARDRTVWARMQALGLEFLGPQTPMHML